MNKRTILTGLFAIGVFSIMASACVCPPLPPCYHRTSGYPTCGIAWNCNSANCETCSGGSCVSSCVPANCEICSGGSCVSSCDPANCETCSGGSCVVCGGDPSQFCCDGACGDSDADEDCCDDKTIYNFDTEHCCDYGTGKTCNNDQTCCHGTNGETCCDNDCQSCCEGTCCDITNCEICKHINNTYFCIRAVPTNMRETSWEDQGDGVLYFEYAWDSTTGDLCDLENCREGECVTHPGATCSDYPPARYDYSPTPPWLCWVWNPVTANNDAWVGCSSDTHPVPYMTKPYQTTSVTCTQVYQYHCGPDCCMGDVSDRSNWQTLLNIGTIYRSITGSGNLWTYTILKSGHYADKSLQ